MKVLQINVINEKMSTGRTTKELGEEIERAGFQSYIAVSQGKENENVYIIGKDFGKKVHAVLSRISGLQGYFSRYSTYKFLKFVKEIGPDIIHLRNLHGNFINLPMLFQYLRKTQTPVVVTLHDCWLYTGKCCHYTSIGCFKWKNECQNCPKLKDDNISWFFDRTKKMQKDKEKFFGGIENLAVVGVSDWIKEEAKKSKVFAKTKYIERIYNWIDNKNFYPVESDELRLNWELKEKFIILSVASGWSEKKGLDKITRLAEILPEDIVIMLIGQVNIPYSYPDNIKIVGTINSTETLAQYYSMADVYLNMSLEESFGKVSAEALSCGTPVIAINSTANAELVGGNCGFVVEKFDEYEILEKILLIKKVTKKAFTESCIKFSQENFDREKNTKKYLQLYAEILKEKKC